MNNFIEIGNGISDEDAWIAGYRFVKYEGKFYKLSMPSDFGCWNDCLTRTEVDESTVRLAEINDKKEII